MTVRPHSPTAPDKEEQEISDGQIPIPRFSVILCTYNRRDFVLATLATLRRQTLPYGNFEVIVVDNGSQDGTLSAVTSYVQMGEQRGRNPQDRWQVRCLCEPRNGLAHARNAGLLVASGEIAVFIDDDTLVDSHMLESLWTAYEETKAAAIGMRVGLHWDMPSPHWMVGELLETL